MAWTRFRTFEEARAALVVADRLSPGHLARLEALWRTSARLAGPPVVVRGVAKFHSIEAAATARELVLVERMRRLRRERGLG